MSCYGRCALSVIIPVISVLKVQPVIIPTALLSTHIGGFQDFTFLDLTGEIKKIIAHYEKLNLVPDCVYTGFLGSEAQIKIIADYIKNQKQKGAYIFVDPVMADDGKLYSSYTESMKQNMIKLAMSADIITPNITEAFFLIGMDYKEPPYSEDFIDELIFKLFELCEYKIKEIVITSIMTDNGKYGVAYGENINKKITTGRVFTRRHEKNYPGSGDIFSSVLCGMILNGAGLYESIECAVKFIDKVMDYTINAGTPVREGLIFEKFLGEIYLK